MKKWLVYTSEVNYLTYHEFTKGPFMLPLYNMWEFLSKEGRLIMGGSYVYL